MFQIRDRFQRERPGTAFPKLFWQWELRFYRRNAIVRKWFCYLLYFSYKKHPTCTKIRLFEIQNRFFSVEGHSLHSGEGDSGHPSLHPASRLDPCAWALELGASFPLTHLLILKPPLFGTHTCWWHTADLPSLPYLAGDSRILEPSPANPPRH